MKWLYFIPLFLSIGISQDYTIDTLIWNGPSSNRINIVFVGDGFTQSNIAAYSEWTQEVSQQIFSNDTQDGIPTYYTYKKAFNIFSIRTTSQQSGITASPGNTLFNCYLNGSSGWVTGNCDQNKIYDVIEEHIPEYDETITVFNASRDRHRATGGPFIYIPIGDYPEILQHELGHNVGDLGDEYLDCQDTKVNISATANRASIKWNAWMDNPNVPLPTPSQDQYNNDVGAFATVQNASCYGPKRYCLMRGYSRIAGVMNPFCPVCAEKMILDIYNKVKPIDGKTPDNSQISLEQNENVEFKIHPVMAGYPGLEIQWTMDGQIIPSQNDSIYSPSSTPLPIGNHVLQAIVSDNTDKVRRGLDLLKDTVSWNLTVEPASGLVQKDESLKPFEFTNFQGIPSVKFETMYEGQIQLYFRNIQGQEQLILKSRVDRGAHQFSISKLPPGIGFLTLKILPNNKRKEYQQSVKVLIQ